MISRMPLAVCVRFLGLLLPAAAAGQAFFAEAGETLLVGANADFDPFEFIRNNEIVGFDIDLMTAVGQAAGFEPKFLNQPFDALVESLAAGQVQAIISGIAISKDRRRHIDFSDPYFHAAQVIVAGGDAVGLSRIEDIRGRRVAVRLGTTGAAMAMREMGGVLRQLKQFRGYGDAFDELALGRVDCVVVDLPVAVAYLRRGAGLKISSPPIGEEFFGIGVAKGDKTLLDRINHGLGAIRKSGEYDRLLEKWFGEQAGDAAASTGP